MLVKIFSKQTDASNILDKVYPIGSIYISIKNTNPNTFIGGAWKSIGSNRVLMGVTSGHNAGTTTDSGLPNISGVTNNMCTGNAPSSGSNSAITIGSSGNYNAKQASGWDDYYQFQFSSLNFNASKSNSIYGKSSIVQPPAYYVYFWQRTA